MLVIADNLSVRNAAYMDAVKKKDKKAIAAMAKELASHGADMINVQVSRDGVGDEELLPMAVEAVQGAVDLPLCLDSRNVKRAPEGVPAVQGAAHHQLPLCRREKPRRVLRPGRGKPSPTWCCGRSRERCRPRSRPSS